MFHVKHLNKIAVFLVISGKKLLSSGLRLVRRIFLDGPGAPLGRRV